MNTDKTYTSGWNSYIRFCMQMQFEPFPLDQTYLEYFVTSLARRVKFDTIRTYLAGIQYYSVLGGFPQRVCNMTRLYYVLRGIRRSQAGDSRRVPRQAISPVHMAQLFTHFQSAYTLYDSTMLRAAVCLAFFGLLRSAEYTAPSITSWDPQVHLSRADVQFHSPTQVSVTLKA